MKKLFLASALCASALIGSPAAAEVLRYDLVGTQPGKYTASFSFDTARVPSSTTSESIRFNGVPITFTRPNSTVVETASFSNTGPTFNALINQGGLFLGFLGGFPTGFSVGGAQLYSGTTSNPTFLTGVFDLSDVSRNFTTDPLQVNYRLTVSRVTAAAAVPEPATWAMMLIGFGMAASVMRSRRRNGIAAQAA